MGEVPRDTSLCSISAPSALLPDEPKAFDHSRISRLARAQVRSPSAVRQSPIATLSQICGIWRARLAVGRSAPGESSRAWLLINQVGFNVRYRLGEEESTVQMDHDPGERIPVQDGQLMLVQQAGEQGA